MSNEAKSTGFIHGWAGARRSEETDTDDHFSQLLVTHPGDGTIQRNVYVAVRMDDGTVGSGGGELEAHIFAYRWDIGEWRLRKKDGTSYGTLASLSEAAPSLPFTIRLEAEGNGLRAYVNGALKLSATDSSFGGPSHRQVGLLSCCGDPNPTVDDFEAGDQHYASPCKSSRKHGRADDPKCRPRHPKSIQTYGVREITRLQLTKKP